MADTTIKPKKIMFVDDDKFLLDMYAVKFNKAGYEVKNYDSTDMAFKALQEGYVPDVILVDIVMPEMDGLEFVQKMRKENLATGSVVIMLTNQGTSEDIGKAQQMSVDGYIVKATSIPSEVLSEVEKIYNSRKLK